jgi:hypothetical protein
LGGTQAAQGNKKDKWRESEKGEVMIQNMRGRGRVKSRDSVDGVRSIRDKQRPCSFGRALVYAG